ncbi:MAG: M20 aminoacylase family protein, partial [Paracoccaceae bacterium]
QRPELGFECHDTARYVVEQLKSFGISEIHTEIATSGVVAIIQGQGEGPTIGLRADMDALPIAEAGTPPYASVNAGRMHACGHDGHTTMLLAAARYLAETRRFAGRVALIFQPAEEFGGGGEVMVREGVLKRFEIKQIFALHNAPGLPPGQFHTATGPIMAAVDTFKITLTGQGGHAALPHLTKDPVVAAAALVMSIQTIVSRNAYALDEMVVSVTQIQTGSADNIVPGSAFVSGTVRSFDPEVQAMIKSRLSQIVAGHAAAYDIGCALDYQTGYPMTVNYRAQTEFAVEVAREVAGPAAVTSDMMREMGAEDFSYFLQKCPGAYLFIGQGDTAALHNPAYDFNDDIAPVGASFFARLVERALPV